MKRILVKSSNLKAVGYESEIMEIEFLNGSVYEYSEVPQEKYDDLMSASSQGKYYNQYIKGQFPSKKLESVSQ